MKKKEILTLALLVAILPPAWAVASPYFGIKVGPIARAAAVLPQLVGDAPVSCSHLPGRIAGPSDPAIVCR